MEKQLLPNCDSLPFPPVSSRKGKNERDPWKIFFSRIDSPTNEQFAQRPTWMNRVSREEERMLEWKLGGLIGERKAISRRGTFTGLENNVRSVPVVVSVGRRMRIVIRIKGDELFYTFLLWNVFSRDDVQRFTFLKGWRDLHETCAFSCAVADAEIPARENS